MSKPLVHVVFGESAGGALGQALRQDGIADQIIVYGDNLAVGPIDNGDVNNRLNWARQNLKAAGDDAYYYPTAAQVALFWEEFNNAVNRKVIWFSCRASFEYCNFLECLRRASSNDQLFINDFTERHDQRHINGELVEELCPHVAHLHPEYLLKFYGKWELLKESDREKYLREWDLLRSENSAFRVLEDGKLVSAPLDYFDEQIGAVVEDRWLKAARVVGGSMALNWKGDYFNDVGDLVMFSRLNHLIDEGKIVAQGDRNRMRQLEVRRAVRSA